MCCEIHVFGLRKIKSEGLTRVVRIRLEEQKKLIFADWKSVAQPVLSTPEIWYSMDSIQLELTVARRWAAHAKAADTACPLQLPLLYKSCPPSPTAELAVTATRATPLAFGLCGQLLDILPADAITTLHLQFIQLIFKLILYILWEPKKIFWGYKYYKNPPYHTQFFWGPETRFLFISW